MSCLIVCLLAVVCLFAQLIDRMCLTCVLVCLTVGVLASLFIAAFSSGCLCVCLAARLVGWLLDDCLSLRWFSLI